MSDYEAECPDCGGEMMSEITRLCAMYELAIYAALPDNVIGKRKAAIVAHVAAIEAQRNVALAALKELYAQAVGVNDEMAPDGYGIIDEWQSYELRSALRKAKGAIDAAAGAPAESSS